MLYRSTYLLVQRHQAFSATISIFPLKAFTDAAVLLFTSSISTRTEMLFPDPTTTTTTMTTTTTLSLCNERLSSFPPNVPSFPISSGLRRVRRRIENSRTSGNSLRLRREQKRLEMNGQRPLLFTFNANAHCFNVCLKTYIVSW